MYTSVPAGGGIDLAIRADGQTLLSGVLSVSELKRLEVRIDCCVCRQERVFGDDGVSGGGEVVVG